MLCLFCTAKSFSHIRVNPKSLLITVLSVRVREERGGWGGGQVIEVTRKKG